MHDPLTLIWSGFGCELWHRDPENHGDSDSCGYLSPRLTKQEADFANNLIDHPDSAWRNVFSRHPSSSDESHLEECKYEIRYLFRAFKKEIRPWYKHPRWHFWHWQFKINFIQKLKRWLFSKCQECGKGFSWDYCPIGTWNGEGPMWFRSEIVFHNECDPSRKLYADQR